MWCLNGRPFKSNKPTLSRERNQSDGWQTILSLSLSIYKVIKRNINKKVLNKKDVELSLHTEKTEGGASSNQYRGNSNQPSWKPLFLQSRSIITRQQVPCRHTPATVAGRIFSLERIDVPLVVDI